MFGVFQVFVSFFLAGNQRTEIRTPCRRSGPDLRSLISDLLCFLRGGPRMRLPGLDEGEDRHEQSKSGKKAVADHRFESKRLGSGEAPAVDVHVQKVGARNYGQKAEHDE